MTTRSSFDQGALAGILLMLGCDAVYWFIGSSQAANASTFRTAAVVAQGIIGIGGASWLYVRQRSRMVRA